MGFVWGQWNLDAFYSYRFLFTGLEIETDWSHT